ncbi:hypothetical protein KIN20_000441 [Parelaphostrongylus tenuis]|uniref:Potassium channel domain-containing protein n=1 Tax=Parelaphostrongylus tenuis TaxID=148309 RepID=A0AAD5QBU9_PARTN|nr:hypothetical protein KIN20_000441 [Parelaphostrongylus tenuis]
MDQQLREIEGLLESSTHPKSDDATTRIKKYVKLVLPHVALVAVVCLYAVIGAYIFYRLESPNEDRLKAVGKALIGDMRNNLISMIQDGRGSEKIWRDSIEKELYRFNDKIYRAFKEQFVRYADVHVVPSTERLKWENWIVRRDIETPNYAVKKEIKCGRPVARCFLLPPPWLLSVIFSLLFFYNFVNSGYGNIVPATSSGRIACVVFALFGAPLAIITIGDLGKFLSECTIWLYREMKKARSLLHSRWRRFRGLNKESDDAESQTTSTPTVDWEELVMDKTEVPVFMVFTILLFRGTDLLQLLRRKRMIERRLAMGEGDEILQMYIQQIQQQMFLCKILTNELPAFLLWFNITTNVLDNVSGLSVVD